VPFGAALRRLAAVVLARCSAPEWVRLIADSGAVGGTHSTGCRKRFSIALQSGQAASVLAPVPPCDLGVKNAWLMPGEFTRDVRGAASTCLEDR
jgi:hypothetical protein